MGSWDLHLHLTHFHASRNLFVERENEEIITHHHHQFLLLSFSIFYHFHAFHITFLHYCGVLRSSPSLHSLSRLAKPLFERENDEAKRKRVTNHQHNRYLTLSSFLNVKMRILITPSPTASFSYHFLFLFITFTLCTPLSCTAFVA